MESIQHPSVLEWRRWWGGKGCLLNGTASSDMKPLASNSFVWELSMNIRAHETDKYETLRSPHPKLGKRPSKEELGKGNKDVESHNPEPCSSPRLPGYPSAKKRAPPKCGHLSRVIVVSCLQNRFKSCSVFTTLKCEI